MRECWERVIVCPMMNGLRNGPRSLFGVPKTRQPKASKLKYSTRARMTEPHPTPPSLYLFLFFFSFILGLAAAESSFITFGQKKRKRKRRAAGRRCFNIFHFVLSLIPPGGFLPAAPGCCCSTADVSSRGNFKAFPTPPNRPHVLLLLRLLFLFPRLHLSSSFSSSSPRL